MTDFASHGVVWLEEPVPVEVFATGDPDTDWEVLPRERAAVLVPGQALTDGWDLEDDWFVLLPGPQPGTVAGLVWESDHPEWRVKQYLDEFAQHVPDARAVVWGQGSHWDPGVEPCVYTYVTGVGFHTVALAYRPEPGELFPEPPQRRDVRFDTAEALAAAAAPPPVADLPPVVPAPSAGQGEARTLVQALAETLERVHLAAGGTIGLDAEQDRMFIATALAGTVADHFGGKRGALPTADPTTR
jgi:hypothetical protein